MWLILGLNTSFVPILVNFVHFDPHFSLQKNRYYRRSKSIRNNQYPFVNVYFRRIIDGCVSVDKRVVGNIYR